MFLALLIYLLLASTYFVIKFVLQIISPLFLTGLTGLLAGVLIFVFFCKRTESLKLYKKIILTIVIASLCTSIIAPFLRFYSAQFLEPFEMSFLISLDPLITLFLSYIFSTEKINWFQSFGIILTLISSIFLACMQKGSFVAPHYAVYALLLGSIVVNRSGWFFISKYTQKPYLNLVMLSSFLSLIGGSTSLASSLFLENVSLTLTVSLMMAILYLVLINNIVCSISYLYFIKQYGIIFLSLLELMVPLFVTGIAVVFLHASMPPFFLLSLIGTLVGIGIFFYNAPPKNSGRTF